MNIYLYEHNFDILCIAESWLNSQVPDSMVVIEGYDLFHKDRADKHGRDVAMYSKKSFEAKYVDHLNDNENITESL